MYMGGWVGGKSGRLSAPESHEKCPHKPTHTHTRAHTHPATQPPQSTPLHPLQPTPRHPTPSQTPSHSTPPTLPTLPRTHPLMIGLQHPHASVRLNLPSGHRLARARLCNIVRVTACSRHTLVIMDPSAPSPEGSRATFGHGEITTSRTFLQNFKMSSSSPKNATL